MSFTRYDPETYKKRLSKLLQHPTEIYNKSGHKATLKKSGKTTKKAVKFKTEKRSVRSCNLSNFMSSNVEDDNDIYGHCALNDIDNFALNPSNQIKLTKSKSVFVDGSNEILSMTKNQHKVRVLKRKLADITISENDSDTSVDDNEMNDISNLNSDDNYSESSCTNSNLFLDVAEFNYDCNKDESTNKYPLSSDDGSDSENSSDSDDFQVLHSCLRKRSSIESGSIKKRVRFKVDEIELPGLKHGQGPSIDEFSTENINEQEKLEMFRAEFEETNEINDEEQNENPMNELSNRVAIQEELLDISDNAVTINESMVKEIDINDEEFYLNNSLEIENIDVPIKIINTEMTEAVNYFFFKDSLFILLHDKIKLYFNGCMNITILNGSLDLLGYTLTKLSESVEVFSPRGSSFLYFESRDKEESLNLEELYKSFTKLGITNVELVKKIRPTTVVMLCKPLSKTKISFLEKHISQQIFPRCQYSPQCIFQDDSDTWNIMKINDSWNAVINDIHMQSRIFICGGKSVGKSVFLRYSINKLLLRYSEILVIDLDPGQPEFTIPGCISANIVNKPVFGPNYTHLRKPHKCLFIPHINIGYKPNKYLTIVEHLMKLCEDLPEMPVLINYMGFTRGLGFNLLSAVIACSSPTDVLEIRSNIKQRNFHMPLTYESITAGTKLFASETQYIPTFSINHIPSMADENQGWHLEPRQIREMCILLYLSEVLPKDVLSLTSENVPIYVVNLSSIEILSEDQTVHTAVANASLVALCTKINSGIYECHGWGIVRGINMASNELFLITPISAEDLERVNCVIIGSVTLPPSLYMTSDDNIGLLPYVTSSYEQTFSQSQIPKRSHLPRISR